MSGLTYPLNPATISPELARDANQKK
ncbi:hypothetical protein JL09_g6233 [Pichia kudriavzevii]|uniref:Uncharacterized protein n=1 Tax=Pichia kudriavzevii TaxID=4909 RepID=A0A099NRB4_PICKU|nr:hypothetical protein JL09_g6233 [Pichia kudriavzevii]